MKQTEYLKRFILRLLFVHSLIVATILVVLGMLAGEWSSGSAAIALNFLAVFYVWMDHE